MCNSNKTVKLYDIDAYATEFEATVLSCEEIQKDGETSYKIILDKTLFFERVEYEQRILQLSL